MIIEYLTLAVYFGFLLALGGIFARFNRGLSDFARGGSRLTWWMVGTSITMAGISAFTFTGNASAAFEAGPSLLVIYAANLLGFFLGGVVLARWYRNTRAYTGADVIRDRFGPAAEQFSIYSGLLIGPFSSAVQLWALAVFVSSVFGFHLGVTIVAVGLITLFYSASGGAWAVIATDFVQGIVLFGITILLGLLAWLAIGGVAGFSEHLADPELAGVFIWIKEPGAYPENRYTWGWAAVVFVLQLAGQIQLSTATRYLSAKDGREASRAAWLAFGLMAVGSLVWFLPPMAARLLYYDQVMAMPVGDPATTAYAVAAMNLLPKGLMGVVIAAMFAATMSSMDSGLNSQTSIIVRNLLPALRVRLGLPRLEEARELRLCRIISVVLGLLIIIAALLLSNQTRFVLFDAFLTLSSVIGGPMGVPLLAGLLLRRLPASSYFFIFAAGLVPSVYSLAAESLGQPAWTIQQRGGWVLAWGAVATIICWLMRRKASEKHRGREVEFFKKIATPVDFEREVGKANDRQQATLLGGAVTVVGLLLFGFLLVPNGMNARLQIVCLAVGVFTVGAALWTWGRRKKAPNTGPGPV
ncbi:MAG: hypothetical protein ABII82_06870 [Verrucomicrobiota bacterium]